MKPIQMVDLKSQYEKIKTDIEKEINEVLESSAFINGPKVHEFQSQLEKYLDCPNVIPCANGTDALQVALMALGLEKGDEIITANFTFAATVEVIELLGLKSVLVDVDYNTFTLSVEEVKKAITPKTKAIIPVHLFGQSADMEPLMEIAKEYNLYVVEDTAQALGASYNFANGSSKMAGTIGHIGTTSFFPSKNLGCYGDGGAIFTHDNELALTMRGIVNHGMYKRYYHDVLGVNSRLDSIQAAILKVKLPKLDTYNSNREKAATYYDNAFINQEHIKIPERGSYSNHVFHQYTLRIGDGRRDELKAHLESKGIPSMIYYPVPLHQQKAYKHSDYKDEDFPNTMLLAEAVLSLPMHSEFTEDQLQYITESVLEFFGK